MNTFIGLAIIFDRWLILFAGMAIGYFVGRWSIGSNKRLGGGE